MGWFVVLGLISLALLVTGGSIAAMRIRNYLRETEARRIRAFAEMMEIAEGKNSESRIQNPE